MAERTAAIPEHPGAGRLGRHVHFDDRSRDYPLRAKLPSRIVRKKTVWYRRGVLDQGNLGSCTGNAMVGLLSTTPWRKRIGHHLDEHDAVTLYSKATSLDVFDGQYPPDDTGSSTLGVLKAAAALGYISEYRWGFGLDDTLDWLSTKGPVIVGVNWYEGFDTPNDHGWVKATGAVRGGHEFEIIGLDPTNRTVRAVNSWGSDWGDHGRFTFTWADLDKLLHEDGDCGAPTG